jgi:hypothetical protein
MAPAEPMRTSTPDKLDELAETLAALFYVLMTVSLLALATAPVGTAVLFLILGGIAHVLRVGCEELARPAKSA